MGINDRFFSETPALAYHKASLPVVVALTTTQTSQAGASTSDVTGSSLKLRPEDFKPGTAFRFTMGGTKSGANAAMIVHISLAGTQIVSITADASTAVEWTSQITVAAKTMASQVCIGQLFTDTEDAALEYAAGSVNMKGGGVLKAQIQSQHGSDTVTCEFCMIEMLRTP